MSPQNGFLFPFYSFPTSTAASPKNPSPLEATRSGLSVLTEKSLQTQAITNVLHMAGYAGTLQPPALFMVTHPPKRTTQDTPPVSFPVAAQHQVLLLLSLPTVLYWAVTEGV